MARQSLLKLGLVAAVLLAGSGVGYYYAVYLPRRDAQLDDARRLDKERAETEKRAAQLRLLAQQQGSEQRRAEAQAAAMARYQTCLGSAGSSHDASWAAECKRIGEEASQNHADCLSKLKLSQAYCDSAYRFSDAAPNCALPPVISSGLDADLNKARTRCLREREAAEQ